MNIIKKEEKKQETKFDWKIQIKKFQVFCTNYIIRMKDEKTFLLANILISIFLLSIIILPPVAVSLYSKRVSRLKTITIERMKDDFFINYITGGDVINDTPGLAQNWEEYMIFIDISYGDMNVTNSNYTNLQDSQLRMWNGLHDREESEFVDEVDIFDPFKPSTKQNLKYKSGLTIDVAAPLSYGRNNTNAIITQWGNNALEVYKGNEFESIAPRATATTIGANRIDWDIINNKVSSRFEAILWDIYTNVAWEELWDKSYDEYGGDLLVDVDRLHPAYNYRNEPNKPEFKKAEAIKEDGFGYWAYFVTNAFVFSKPLVIEEFYSLCFDQAITHIELSSLPYAWT